MKSVVAEHLPVLREFVGAVKEHDELTIWSCLQYTPPGTMAEIAAAWIAELLEERETMMAEILRMRELVRAAPKGDVMRAYRISHEKRQIAEAKVSELRAEVEYLHDQLAKHAKGRKAA